MGASKPRGIEIASGRSATIWELPETNLPVVDLLESMPKPSVHGSRVVGEEMPERSVTEGEWTFSVSDVEGGLAIVGCLDNVNEVVIPPYLDDLPVVAIAPRAFSGHLLLTSIQLPEGLESIGSFAFMGSNITEVVLPSTVTFIDEKAFYRCLRLEHVQLNEGLEVIGDSAFSDVPITELHLPTTLHYFGYDCLMRTKLDFSEGNRPLTVAEGNPYIVVDDFGGVYMNTENGLMLRQMVNPRLKEHTLLEGTRVVGDAAYRRHKSLKEVTLPEGVEAVGRNAFRSCELLKKVNIPSTLKGVGSSAFKECSVEEFYLPAGFEYLGEDALHTFTLGNEIGEPALKHIVVDPANERFYVTDDILCQRGENGDTACTFAGMKSIVCIPREVRSVSSYAFAGVLCVERLIVHDGIDNIGIAGFDFGSAPRFITVESCDANGEDYIIEYPSGGIGRNAVHASFRIGRVDVPRMYKSVDRFVMGDMFTRSRLMLNRLKNPIFMEDSYKATFISTIDRDLPKICVEFGAHGYFDGLNDLKDLGFFTRDSIESALAATIEAKETAATSWLMGQRGTFEGSFIDFDL